MCVRAADHWEKRPHDNKVEVNRKTRGEQRIAAIRGDRRIIAINASAAPPTRAIQSASSNVGNVMHLVSISQPSHALQRMRGKFILLAEPAALTRKSLLKQNTQVPPPPPCAFKRATV